MRAQLAIAATAALAACSVGDLDGGQARETFARDVAPILERDCGTNACHAADDARYDELPASYFVFPVDAAGRIAGEDRMAKAYARSVEKLAAGGARSSDLLRKPLDESLGGLAHRGGTQYRTETDEDYQTLLAWAEGARPRDEVPLSPLARRYADDIEPIFAKERCMLASCHGAGASNLLIFDPGVRGELDATASLRNYKKVVTHLNLETPDPRLSRLVRKTIPVDQGGIFHRGGNDFFDPAASDPDLAAIEAFVRDARVALGDANTGVVTGLVFAATDPTPRSLFDIAAWQPGGDIYSLIPAEPGGTLANLTAAHHAGPADIRDPAVSYDGQRIAFAMRRDETDCLNLYVMNVDGSGLSQLTRDTGTLANGIKVSNVEPLWGPDDRIYFVSTRAGVLTAAGDAPMSNVWRVDADGQHLLRMSYSAGNELAPAWRRFPAHGEHAVEQRTLDLTFTSTREVGNRMFAPLMRVPPDFRADYHPHFGTQHPDYQIFTQMTQFTDLREVLILMDETNVWEGGALALIDRNLGPPITDGNESAVVNYVEPLQILGAIGDEVTHRGQSPDGYYRDPYALPDGAIVVVHSPVPIDHADPTAAPDPALYRLELIELPRNRTVVSRKQLLVDVPAKVETDPRPIVARRREEIGDPLHHLSNDADSGTLLNFDLAVALTVASEDSPSGTKEFDAMAERIRWVRLVEEVPPQPGARAGRSRRGVRRVLAEFPATSDRSMFLRLPAGIPFFIQALDDARMTVATFNQWFFVLPGEQLKQVTRREVWNNRCGACHGSRSGEPGQTVGTPDVLTQASRVVANYDAATRTDLDPLPFGLSPDDRVEVDFERDIQPVLTARCATSTCHVAGAQSPDLSARPGTAGWSGAYEALTDAGDGSGNGFAYVDPLSGSAQTSFLAEVLLGRELGAPRDVQPGGCPGGSAMSLTEIATLMRWMDLGASYVGIAPKIAPQLETY